MTKTILLYVPTLEGGGAERVFVNLANHFTKKGYRVLLLCAYGDSYSNILNPDVEIKRCFKKPPFKSELLNKVSRIVAMPLFMISLMASNRSAALFTSILESDMLGNVAHFVTRSKGKLIIAQAGLIEDVTHPGKLSIFLLWAFKRAHAIIANSPKTKESIITFYPASQKKIVLIGNPVYEEKSSSTNPFEDKYLLSVGRFESQKDHHTLIKAFKIVSSQIDIRLKLVGTGSLQEDLSILINKLGITHKVDFEGFRSDTDVYYEHATAFVLSSSHETFANVIVEAMSFGIPVISTACGGPSYIINNRRIGVLTPVADYKKLASTILNVLHNLENYDKDLIIRRAQDFSIDKIGDAYLKLIEE